MKHFWRIASKPVYIPFLDRVEDTYHAFTASGRVLFYFFVGLLILSTCALLFILNTSIIVPVPSRGGSLSEGIVGSPRFINPILAISDADGDMTSLVYSGLLKATPEGTYIPDLASGYTVSPDGKTYTVTLKAGATFQDGTPVTADDVVFTVQKAQDPLLKSPEQSNWSGVVVQKIDTETVQFTLKGTYVPFVENLTLGILPKHLWQNVSDEEFPFSELNSNPVGSGPYRVASVDRTPAGIPSSYTLTSFGAYALGEPYLSELDFHFYQSEDAVVAALKSKEIEAAAELSSASLTQLNGFNIATSSLNRVFGVFFNQNQSTVLRDHDVRRALEDAIDRKALVQSVLGGYGTPLTGPVPQELLPVVSAATTTASTTPVVAAVATTTDPALLAKQELIQKGWVVNADGFLQKTTGKGKDASTVVLSFSLSTGNVPELRAAAQYVVEQWQRMGAKVDLQIYDQGDLSQNVIRPRKYDALLFGEVVGRDPDLYAFWHSSQRNDPGLNIALYANPVTDKILEQLRTTLDDTDRAQLYGQFEAAIDKDIPAIFLYTPDFVYTIPKDIQGLDLGFIGTPSDRFLSVTQWHRETDYVWPMFVNNK